MKIGTHSFHPPWYTLEGIGLVFVINAMGLVFLMPVFINGMIHWLGLERTLLAGIALIAPYLVLQALGQALLFIPISRAAKRHFKIHLARGMLFSAITVSLLGLAVIGYLVESAMRLNP